MVKVNTKKTRWKGLGCKGILTCKTFKYNCALLLNGGVIKWHTMGLAVMHNYTISEGGSFCVNFCVFWRIFNFLQESSYMDIYIFMHYWDPYVWLVCNTPSFWRNSIWKQIIKHMYVILIKVFYTKTISVFYKKKFSLFTFFNEKMVFW